MRTLAKRPVTMMPSIFDELFFGDNLMKNKNYGSFNPSVNIAENDAEYGIELAAPGFNKEDFNIKIENDILTISAEINEENKEEATNYTRIEFKKQSFSRSFTLPENEINEEEIKANYKNGLLLISLPKKEEAKPKAPHTIEIQ